jgi:hypothetical protein
MNNKKKNGLPTAGKKKGSGLQQPAAFYFHPDILMVRICIG